MRFVGNHCTCIYSFYFLLLSILANMQCKLSEQLAVFHIDYFQMFCAVVDIISMKAFFFFFFWDTILCGCWGDVICCCDLFVQLLVCGCYIPKSKCEVFFWSMQWNAFRPVRFYQKMQIRHWVRQGQEVCIAVLMYMLFTFHVTFCSKTILVVLILLLFFSIFVIIRGSDDILLLHRHLYSKHICLYMPCKFVKEGNPHLDLIGLKESLRTVTLYVALIPTTHSLRIFQWN